MTLELIAVAGMTVEIDQAPGGELAAVIVVSPPTAQKVKCEGALVHRDDDKITVSGITAPGAVPPATIADSATYIVDMTASAEKVTAEGALVLREGDKSLTINATPEVPGSPPVKYPVSFQCIVTDPNQTTVKAQ